MSPHERSSLLRALDEIRGFVESLSEDKECGTCIHFKNFLCGLCNDFPPSEVVKVGCPQWTFDKDSCPF
jgi:hypothetical protein